MVIAPMVNQPIHYVSHGTPIRADGTQAFPPACRAAVVTEVDPDDPGLVGIAVTNPTGMFFHPIAAGGSHHVAADQQLPTPGTWHYMH